MADSITPKPIGTPFNFQPLILIMIWIIIAGVLFFITRNIKKQWLRGAILGLLIPIAVFLYGVTVSGFGGLVWFAAYAPIMIIPGVGLGAFIGYLCGNKTTKSSSLWVIFSGMITSLYITWFLTGGNIPFTHILNPYYWQIWFYPLLFMLIILVGSVITLIIKSATKK